MPCAEPSRYQPSPWHHSPNPPVDRIILDSQGNTVGQGYHQRKGELHAEAYALTAAGSQAADGTAVVTLEPCNHHDRDPPCHQALIGAKIARAVIAVIDPTSRGEGCAAKLRTAGVNVDVGVLTREARLVLGPWLNSLGTGRPHVTWVYVLNDQGPGLGLGSTARTVATDAHLLRIQTDAVLNADSHVEEGILNSHDQRILHLTPLAPSAGPRDVLASLHAGGVRSVLISGGRSIMPFVQAELVDRIVAYLTVEKSSTSPRSGGHDIMWPLLPQGFVITNIKRLGTYSK